MTIDCCNLRWTVSYGLDRTSIERLVGVEYDLPMWQFTVVSGTYFVIYIQSVTKEVALELPWQRTSNCGVTPCLSFAVEVIHARIRELVLILRCLGTPK